MLGLKLYPDLYTRVICSLFCDANKTLRATDSFLCTKFSQSLWCDEKSVSSCLILLNMLLAVFFQISL